MLLHIDFFRFSGFAIPIDMVKGLVEQILTYGACKLLLVQPRLGPLLLCLVRVLWLHD